MDCRLCPAGFQCDPVNGTLSLCPPGQHSPEGVLKCLSCPVDSICTSGFPIKVSRKVVKEVLSLMHLNLAPTTVNINHTLFLLFFFVIFVW